MTSHCISAVRKVSAWTGDQGVRKSTFLCKVQFSEARSAAEAILQTEDFREAAGLEAGWWRA